MSDAPAAEKKTSLWTLFITFAKVGVMTFGGGYAMLPILEREVVKNHNWTTSEQMLDYYAIGQCTPGIIAVNVSTFIGYKTRGILGAIVATFGMVFPSLVIITALASVLKMFQDNVYVKKAFAGIRIAVCALMVTAVIGLVRKAVSNIPTAIVAVAALLLQMLLGVSPVIIVICTVAFGLIMYFSTVKRNADAGNKEVQK
ncbi:MAG: chromate transporter [Spirochaetales bacterium]|nr:chromate transporter [Spirochaetales bacterium]